MTFALIDNLLTIYVNHFSGEDLRTHLEGKSERFLSNLEAIRREAEGVGAELVVANQQERSMLLNDVEIQGKTYADELLTVKSKLEEEGWLGRLELFFLTHAVLMDDLREWAEESDVPFVDAIGATDSRRDLLVSWVHLKPEGNQVISEAFADVIFTRACRQ